MIIPVIKMIIVDINKVHSRVDAFCIIFPFVDSASIRGV